MTGKRVLVLTVAAVAAALSAKGMGSFHTNGFFDGPLLITSARVTASAGHCDADEFLAIGSPSPANSECRARDATAPITACQPLLACSEGDGEIRRLRARKESIAPGENRDTQHTFHLPGGGLPQAVATPSAGGNQAG